MYRKFKADKIFDGSVFTSHEKVLITSADLTIIDIVNLQDAGDNVEHFPGILSPGFINCHCHLELSHLKGQIAQHTGLVDFLLQVMTTRFKNSDNRRDIQLAVKEQYDTGTVAIGDICNTSDTIEIKKLHGLYFKNFIEVSGFVNATAEDRLAAVQKVAEEFTTNGLQQTLVPHAPYSVSAKLFRLLNNITSTQLISIHNQEEKTEDDLYKSADGNFLKLYKALGIDISGFEPTGKTSFQSWRKYFNQAQKILSVHNTFISKEDLAFAADVFFCICINSNLYIENSLPPLDMLIENNNKIVLGTDSYASNTSLNMLDEIKTIQKHFPHIRDEILLQWATKNGAEALGISEQFGSFEKGKTPGVIIIQYGADNVYASSKRIV